MSPHLLYVQAIKGRVTGRGIGIIDAIHLIEVAKSIQVLNDLGCLKEEDFSALQTWFATFVDWLSPHPYGIDELARTKPYNYSLFNLERYSILAHVASTPDDDL